MTSPCIITKIDWAPPILRPSSVHFRAVVSILLVGVIRHVLLMD